MRLPWSKTYNLAVLYPKLAKEWHSEKNDYRRARDFTPGAHHKAWWQCKKGHEWQSCIFSRTYKQQPRNCPYCAGKKVCQDNCLAVLYPHIVLFWHPSKNKKTTPYGVRPFSLKKVWWKCIEGHSWKAPIARVTSGHGCPYCKSKKVCKANSLAKLFPYLAKEWHPFKNKLLKPDEVTFSSHKKVWWICRKEHAYQATINNRTNKGKQRGCPYCAGKSKSRKV